MNSLTGADDKIYVVMGGEFEDTSFKRLAGKPEFYGPFNTYEEARRAWWAGTCKQVDNCHHRLTIIPVKAA